MPPIQPPISRRAIELLAAFEADWQRGGEPSIEAYLTRVPESERDAALETLLRSDIRHRSQNGAMPTVEMYASLYPSLAERIRSTWTALSVSSPTPILAPADGTAVSNGPPPAKVVFASMEPRRPDRIGEYELLERLGEGGMGEVWKARHRRLHKIVALKMIGADMAGSRRALERFENEARVMGPLEHPHIAKASDAGEADGVVYLAMELIDGEDLGRVIREKGPLPPAEAYRITAQAAEALAYLHRNDVIHRDIKPSNLMRRKGGVVVVDFGIARRKDSELTQMGAGMGTPDYMPPEQIDNAADVEGSADVYALGCTLYALLTGSGPYAHLDNNDKLNAHRDEAVADIAKVCPAVPPEVAELLRRMMAKSPKDRPSATEVAAVLGRQGDGDKTLTLPPRSAQAPAMRPGWMVVAAMAAVASGLMAWGPWRETKIDPIVPEPPATSLLVLSLDVKHFEKIGRESRYLGVMGKDSSGAMVGDQVTVEGKLSKPAYSYLVAYMPNGKSELCYPDDENEVPPLSKRPHYPPVSKSDKRFGLTDGPGLYVFVLVTSDVPLPSYAEWTRERPTGAPWPKGQMGTPDEVQSYDGQIGTVFAGNGGGGIRGKDAEVEDAWATVTRMTNWWKLASGKNGKVAWVGLVATER